MNYSVVIPSKTASNLVPCVEAIFRHEPDLPRERIICVDDGVSWAECGDRLKGITVVEGAKPFCFSRNCNIGINLNKERVEVTAYGDTEPQYIPGLAERHYIVLNDDAILETPGGFSAMARAAAEHPEYGVIGAACNVVGNRNQFRRGSDGLREDPRMVCFVCVFIPASTIDRVGLLDERFVGYGMDDDDYCFRVRAAGLKIGIFDGCFVDHSKLESSFRGGPKTAGDFRPNMKLFIQKYGTDNWGHSKETSQFAELFS